MRKQRFIAAVSTETREAADGGVDGADGAPTVKVNGTALPSNETLTADGLRDAVLAAR